MPRPLLILPIAALAGCAAPAPTYPWHGPDAALRRLHDNAAAIRSVQATARVVLDRPDGQSVRLDAALVARFPDHLRLRAWKLGQAVFDLTWIPGGLWLATGEHAPHEPDQDLSIPASGFARAWSLFSPDFFTTPLASIESDSGGPTFTVLRRPAPNEPGGVIRCTVERATLRPLLYTALDESGAVRSTLRLDRYRAFSGTFWPGRISAASDRGTVAILIDTAHFTEPLPESAFHPPARAVRQP